ncbi:MAG: DUF6779 domain-containing protein [Mycobacterium sp.]
MTVLSRGARVRRSGHRPGWALLTALLILAFAASSALVFTDRVELLKLAVIVALWAAVMAAFVSVIYRRQSDADQARTRDMKLVYDLQLDREISARREYELTVESQLRRELASELRAQAADEVAALRTELTALRNNLEILFDADLNDRPALEQERTTVRAYSDWGRTGGDTMTDERVPHTSTGRYPDDIVSQTAENPIIDVPEVRIPPSPPPPPQRPSDTPARGSHRRAPDDTAGSSPDSGRWMPPERPERPERQEWPRPYVAPGSPTEPERPASPPPVPPRPPWVAEPAASAGHWAPVAAQEQWLEPGTPVSNWTTDSPADSGRIAAVGRHGDPSHAVQEPIVPADSPAPREPFVPRRAPEPWSRHGRHEGPLESTFGAAVGTEPPPEYEGRRRARAQHSAEPDGFPAEMTPPAPPPAPPPPPRPVFTAPPGPESSAPTRHGAGVEPGTAIRPRTGAHSVADLLARLQPGPPESPRRRRREE